MYSVLGKDGSKLIEGLGKVVRVSEGKGTDSGMGVEFVDFDTESMALIEEICRRPRDKR